MVLKNFAQRTGWLVLQISRAAVLFLAPRFFVFFTLSASNPYNPVCKFPSKTVTIGHSDTHRVRKNALENAFCVHVFSRPQSRSKRRGQRLKIICQRSTRCRLRRRGGSVGPLSYIIPYPLFIIDCALRAHPLTPSFFPAGIIRAVQFVLPVIFLSPTQRPAR